tara:strand:+ start:2674 stop:3402 length:729 start_codon:yes stop_codon:yes gene_type:complete
MREKKILNALNEIGIINTNQFKEGDLYFWWEKKYLEIRYGNLPKKEKENKLIRVNNAKDYLSEIDISEIKSVLNKSISKNYSSDLEKKSIVNDDINTLVNENFKEETLDEENTSNDSLISEFNYYKNNSSNKENKFISEWKKEWKKSSEDVDKIFDNSFTRFLMITFVYPLAIAIAISLFGSGEWIIWIFIYFALYVYFFPSVIAKSRNKKNYWAILVLNLFFGWTLIGWVASLIWALNNVS